MLKVDPSQTIKGQHVTFGDKPAGTGWKPLTKVVLATGIGFAGIAAAYLNRQTLQNEPYAFSSQNMNYPLITVGLIGLGAAGVYLWKRNKVNEVAENPVINQQEPATTHLEKTEPKGTENPNPLVNDVKKSVITASEPEIVVTLEEIKRNEAEEIHTTEYELDISEGKKIIDEALNNIRQDHNDSENPLTAKKLNPFIDKVVKDCIPSKSLSNYDTLHQALFEASKLIQSPDTKAYRNEKGNCDVDSRLMKDYKDRLKDFYKFAKTMTVQTDELNQRLVEKAYQKLLGYSKPRACQLAIDCIGNSGKGCKKIVQNAFTDLVSAANKMEETYFAKYRNAANKAAFKKQFEPLSDKIMQLAGNFILACMEQDDPDCKNIILDAFPVLLKKQSLSGLKFAIYCLERGSEECKKMITSYDDELTNLFIFEASQCNLKHRGKSLADLMSQTPNCNEKELFDFGLEDLRDFQIKTVKTLTSSPDERSPGEDEQSFGESDSSEDFNRSISQILGELNSSSEEETETSTTNIFTMEDI